MQREWYVEAQKFWSWVAPICSVLWHIENMGGAGTGDCKLFLTWTLSGGEWTPSLYWVGFLWSSLIITDIEEPRCCGSWVLVQIVRGSIYFWKYRCMLIVWLFRRGDSSYFWRWERLTLSGGEGGWLFLGVEEGWHILEVRETETSGGEDGPGTFLWWRRLTLTGGEGGAWDTLDEGKLKFSEASAPLGYIQFTRVVVYCVSCSLTPTSHTLETAGFLEMDLQGELQLSSQRP